MNKVFIFILAVCVVLASSAGAGVRVHYKFDNSATDSSGNGNDGIVADDPTYTAGVFGQGIDSDGTDDVGSDGTIDHILISQGIAGMTNATIVFWAAADAWNNNTLYQNTAGYPMYGQLYGQWWNINFNWSQANLNFPGTTDRAYHHYAVTMTDAGGGNMDVEAFVAGSSLSSTTLPHPGSISLGDFRSGGMYDGAN